MSRQTKIISIIFLSFTFVLCSILTRQVQASTTSNVNTTVKVSICGNNLKEGGEDCDNANLGGKTCTDLGYTSGSLSCDNSCSFELSSCVIPAINPNNISSGAVSALLAAGHLEIPQTASVLASPSLTATQQLTIYIPDSGGISSVLLPEDVVITRSDGGDINATTLAAADITPTSLSGLAANTVIDAALQWGIPNATLLFSRPISLSIYVGMPLNGQTLTIVRSENLTSGWTTDGIVAPATCTVVAGLCNFQTTKASYFATIRPSTNTNNATNSTNNSSTSNDSNTSTSIIITPTFFPQSIPNDSSPTTRTIQTLPDLLQLFDLDKNGNIEVTEVSQAIQAWVTARHMSQNETCDINRDKTCDIQDLSILLFYVEK